ncbi:MAG TPA: hypothetical protein VFJ97_06235 [Dermatophilaceae bacterium]|nr:hypothetical protein [Dermatophilaceae bacterium]
MTAGHQQQAGDVLELRIHGVSNTPPRAMLDLPLDGIAQAEGDELGSFWRPTDRALRRLTPVDRGYVPPGVTREAYSWGGLARTSIGGTSALGQLLAVAGRFGWSLLIPFGLVNVAYWSRRLVRHVDLPADGDLLDQGNGPAAMVPLDHQNRNAGGPLRFAGLLLTLLTATTASVVSLDLLAVQCFSASDNPCSGLPSWAGFLYDWSLSRRLALLSLVPVALVLFLWFLAGRSRTRYERATGDQDYGQDSPDARAATAETAAPQWPMLSTPGFWNHAKVSSSTATLHVCAVMLVVSLLTAWHLHFGGGSDCGTFRSVFGPGCRAQATAGAGWAGSLVAIGAYLILLVLVAVLVVVRTDDVADILGPRMDELSGPSRLLRRHGFAVVVGWLSAAAFGHQLLAMAVQDFSFPAVETGGLTGGATRVFLVGASSAVLVELALLVGVSLSALSWRFVGEPWPIVTGLGFTLTLLAAGAAGPGAVRVVLGVAAAALALVTVLPVFVVDQGQNGPRRRYQMWGGCAPGVLLLLASLLCMTIASAVVVTLGNILNGNWSAASLAGIAQPAPAPQTQCPAGCVSAAPIALSAPRPYIWFGALLLLVLVLAVLVAAGVAGRVWLVSRRATLAPAERHALPALPRRAVRAVRLRGGEARDTLSPGPVTDAVRVARAAAARAHRAEKGAALLTYAATAALLGAVSSTAMGTTPRMGTWTYETVTSLMAWGMWTLTLVGAGVVALATGTGAGAGGGRAAAGAAAQGDGSAPGGSRPLGLLWDLICFLPRAGHPYGPPCYAERVVPELLGRYRWWLTAEGTLADGEVETSPRSIVVSAHSLGCVLAVATVLAAPRPGDGRSPVPRLSLLTYGCQLRAYFSRLFPELLGPDVLGSPACRAADLSTADPWATERSDVKPPAPVYPDSVRDLVGGSQDSRGRWVNLWHLTDPLGFPVGLYPPGGGQGTQDAQDTEVDWYAEEVDRTAYLLAVLAHSDYARTAAYASAVEDLSGVPWVPSPVQPPGVAGPVA